MLFAMMVNAESRPGHLEDGARLIVAATRYTDARRVIGDLQLGQDYRNAGTAVETEDVDDVASGPVEH